MNMRRRLLSAFAASGLAAVAPSSWAQKLASGKPIRIVVPYAAGGTTDIMARQVATRLADVLGQPVVIDNKPGGGGTIAGALVASAPADGHTLMLGGMELATTPALMGDRNFLATRDLVAAAALTLGPLVLVVNPQKTPVRTLAELIALARAQPDALTFASAGNASVNHLFTEVFKRTARVEMRHVPYRGAGPALTDLQAGQVNLMIAGTASVRQLVAAGSLRALAVTGNDAAVPGFPGVPTFAQAGVPMPEVDSGAWTGLFAPKNTPRETIAQINQAVNTVLGQAEMRTQLASIGVTAEPGTPESLQALLATQTQNWTRLITQASIKAE